MANFLRRHICLLMGGACCLTNCQLYAGDLVAYSRSFLYCPSRVVEEDKLRIKPPRIHGGKVEEPRSGSETSSHRPARRRPREMQNMRLLERQQHLLLGMRSPDAGDHGQAAQQGVPEAASWLRDAKAQVQAHEAAGLTFQETSWGYRVKRRR